MKHFEPHSRPQHLRPAKDTGFGANFLEVARKIEDLKKDKKILLWLHAEAKHHLNPRSEHE